MSKLYSPAILVTLKRHGSRNDIYANVITGKQAPVPRHPDVNLARYE